ncbi:hypothetical protein L6452_24001 [Arctium lappa]|uniref:Uncharacterized protein n=1 Tax=Arctium lappa TaxID=4217 RepID=A0ACB9A8M7_ARCLA|nr:hypothetical protein L6452_24001 [Arctium lappa]
MILHHLASGILNHKTSIFIFPIKFNVWELGLKSWIGCPRKVSSPRMDWTLFMANGSSRYRSWVVELDNCVTFIEGLEVEIVGEPYTDLSLAVVAQMSRIRGLVALVVTLIRGRANARTYGCLGALADIVPVSALRSEFKMVFDRNKLVIRKFRQGSITLSDDDYWKLLVRMWS